MTISDMTIFENVASYPHKECNITPALRSEEGEKLDGQRMNEYISRYFHRFSQYSISI